jgi:hypothetical protein
MIFACNQCATVSGFVIPKSEVNVSIHEPEVLIPVNLHGDG